MTKLTCEGIARAVLGPPVKIRRDELYWNCLHPEQHRNGDRDPSFQVNKGKNVWACFVCGVHGTPWELAAFLAGLDPGDKPAVKTWLRQKGLLPNRSSKAKGRCKSDDGYSIVETYPYRDVQGRPCLRKHRLEAKGKEKTFSWERLEKGKWLKGRGELQPALYRSNEIEEAVSVQIHEGERKVNRAFDLGFFATSVLDGAKSWKPEYARQFAGKDVHVFPDNDETGRISGQKNRCRHFSTRHLSENRQASRAGRKGRYRGLGRERGNA